ncbi:hypothetical protein [Candidatus Babela massiliensis]|uniref:Uncharacterized protein n=1 Tax=Candidatus Babela massiliensis TaxID=673862 RepID=V6DGK5_9BACT|nr:hypothetical protein [Candidatus Babela massiliensis]CDK30732.1 hypothetical protein BABL1_gene_283 [Candidatus Babela massiliensis]
MIHNNKNTQTITKASSQKKYLIKNHQNIHDYQLPNQSADTLNTSIGVITLITIILAFWWLLIPINYNIKNKSRI